MPNALKTVAMGRMIPHSTKLSLLPFLSLLTMPIADCNWVAFHCFYIKLKRRSRPPERNQIAEPSSASVGRLGRIGTYTLLSLGMLLLVCQLS